MTDDLQAELRIDDDAVVVVASALLESRPARLFFRSILGALPTDDGYRCPSRRSSTASLAVRINSWLEREGYSVRRLGPVNNAVNQALERRRSFDRTRAAAQEFKEDPTTLEMGG